MMLKLKSALLLITLSVLFFSCEKEYSLEGVLNGSAVFSLNGSPAACTSAVVAGTYNVGTALDATNLVTISVTVTTAGTYSISTNTANGISFSGSGSFAAAGAQTITLTGTGTPLANGTFSFTPGTNGCSFSVRVSNGGGGTSGGTAVFALSGAPGNCTSFAPAGTYTAGTALGTGNTATVSVNVTTIGTYTIATNTINGMSFTGAGSFTATGAQTIQLTGTGTPIAGGVFQFTPGTNGCTFSITVTGSSSGSSVFTYGDVLGACTPATPAGTYTAATPLTAANTVSVSVNVTKIGTYAILTPTVNGIYFSSTGSFTATGAQFVTLRGTGTPAAAGDFDFTPSNNGCPFTVTVVAGVNTTDFLKCTIDGVARTFNENLAAIQIDPTSITFSGTESATSAASFDIILTKSPAITTGTYGRLSSAGISTYCLVIYSDGVNITMPWSTGVLPNSGAFNVVVTSFTTSRIAGTFSGTIYNNVATNAGAKTVTAGSFSVPY